MRGRDRWEKKKKEQGPLHSHLLQPAPLYEQEETNVYIKKLIQIQSTVKASLAIPLLILFPLNLETKQTNTFVSTIFAKGFLFTLQIRHYFKKQTIFTNAM